MGPEVAEADAPRVGDEQRGPLLHRMAEPQVEHRKLLLRIRTEPEDRLRLVEVLELRTRPHDAALAERSVIEGGVEGAEVEVGGTDDVAEEQARRVEVLVGGVKRFLDILLAAEGFDDGVTGERLFDLRVELAGVLPLIDESRSRAFGNCVHHEHR